MYLLFVCLQNEAKEGDELWREEIENAEDVPWFSKSDPIQQSVFNYDEVEKISVKMGIAFPTVKDILKSLQADYLV